MEILQKFLGDTTFTKYVQQLDDLIMTTDRHILICKIGQIEGKPLEELTDSSRDNIREFLTTKTHEILEIDSKDLISKLDAHKDTKMFDSKHESCGTCEGSGVVDWAFDHHQKEDDCPDCDGNGEITIKHNFIGFGIPAWYCLKVFEGLFLRCDILYKLISVTDKLTLKNTGKDYILFEFGEYSGVVMRYGEINKKHDPEYVKLDLTTN